MPEETLLTLEEVAKRLNVSVATVRRLINDGELKAIKVRFQLRVKPSDLEDYIARIS
jgi:excisionase family DNA binding protein